MKLRYLFIVIVGCALFLSLGVQTAHSGDQSTILVPTQNETTNPIQVAYDTHFPIYIDDNSDFPSQGFTSNGPGDPWILENKIFRSVQSPNTHLIHIQDTTDFFIIRNCYFDGVLIDWDCINLVNVRNGVIKNNTIIYGSHGITLEFSDNNKISGNNISFSEVGLLLSSSNENRIDRNNVSDNNAFGIEINSGSSDNVVINNNVSRNDAGIVLWGGANNNEIVTNDVFSNQYEAIGLHSTDHNNISDNHVFENGGGIAYESSHFNNVTWNEIHDNGAEGVGLNYDDTNSLVANNTIYGNSVGILITGHSYDNTIADNEIFHNDNGIYLEESSNNHVIHNRCVKNGKGIWLYLSDENVVRDNICRDNLMAGIALWSSNSNTISMNNSTGNGLSGIYLQFSFDNDVITNVCNLNGYSGIFLYVSNENTISGNTCNNNTADGITITDGSNENTVYDNHCSYNIHAGISVISSNGNNISGNTVYVDINPSGDSYGFYLEYSNGNTLSRNFISSKSDGISMFYSSHNLVFHNCITADLIEAEDSFSMYGNYWYHPILLEGNYWSHYTGVDLDGDGIGDTDIPWPGPGFDLYPLVTDSDGDGLQDCAERVIGTDPNNPDTDGDLFSDGDEWLLYHTDPLTPTSPQEAAEAIYSSLQDLVNSGDLRGNNAWSLKRKVDAAIALMDRGNWFAAANKLGDFIDQVNALISSGRLSVEDGDALIAMAQGIIDVLQTMQT